MKVNLSVETTAFFRDRFGPKADKRLAFAVVNALNKTAREVQKAEQDRALSEFQVRQRTFIRRQAAYIAKESFANVRRGVAYVEIAVGQKPRLFLSTFEAGGERVPFIGKHVALPVIGSLARRSKSRRVPEAFQIKNLAFQKGTNSAWRGAQRTYLIPGVGIFVHGIMGKTGENRKGNRAHNSQLIYAFVDPFKLEARLEFMRTARRVAAASFKRNLEDETVKAVIHQGGRA